MGHVIPGKGNVPASFPVKGPTQRRRKTRALYQVTALEAAEKLEKPRRHG